MKVLITGGTSLTGYWFSQALIRHDAEVHATFTRPSLKDYSNDKSSERAQSLPDQLIKHFDASFGSEKFLKLLSTESFDLIALHGASIPNYKSPSFRIETAIAQNLNNIYSFFETLKNKKTPLLLTGTVFEKNEGGGVDAASPYGLAKSLISEAFSYYSNIYGNPFYKFIVPNPFGVFEDQKYTFYLINEWMARKIPIVKTPDYVRDNIHVELLAECYALFVGKIIKGTDQKVMRPSGYVESQAQFTKRLSLQATKYLNLRCQFDIAEQADFSEPIVRHNSQQAKEIIPQFDEEQSWSNFFDYYRKKYSDK